MAPTQKDGPTRNGIVFEVLNALESAGSHVGVCMWLRALGCQGEPNSCVVPHSSASTADNLGAVPYFLYWNQTQRLGLASFLRPGIVPPPNNWNATLWDGT